MLIISLITVAATAGLSAADGSDRGLSSPAFEPVAGGSIVSDSGTSEGSLFSMLPLNGLLGWDPSASDSVLFLEPVAGWQEGGTFQASLGVGFRKLFGDPTHGKTTLAPDINLLAEGWYFGGNLFVDRSHAAHDLDHWQLSSGLEVGSRYVSLHSNYYWPLSEAKRWGQVTTSKVTDRRHGADYELSVGPLITSGPAAGTHDIHVTTTPYQSFREKLTTFGLYDEALRGWDTEVSVLVPVIDKYVDLRVVSGLYGFAGGGAGSGFQGWQMGAEFRPVPAVVLMATRFSDDRFDRGQWMAGVRFEIPLGNHFRDGLKVRERNLSERLLEPVHRHYGPTIASARKREGVSYRSMAPVSDGPASIEGLELSSVPVPGDVIQLQNGRLLVVMGDGKSLRPVSSRGDRVWDTSLFIEHGIIVVVPEPSRILLVLLGVAVAGLRRRRV